MMLEKSMHPSSLQHSKHYFMHMFLTTTDGTATCLMRCKVPGPLTNSENSVQIDT